MRTEYRGGVLRGGAGRGEAVGTRRDACYPFLARTFRSQEEEEWDEESGVIPNVSHVKAFNADKSAVVNILFFI